VAVSEGELQDAIRLALRDVPGLALWRNNVGVALHPDGRRVVYGLAPGSADLVGLVDGRFIALEVKTATGRVRPEQKAWLSCVRAFGGFAAVVRSTSDAVAAVERARRGERE
jgi:hypothetical protein